VRNALESIHHSPDATPSGAAGTPGTNPGTRQASTPGSTSGTGDALSRLVSAAERGLADVSGPRSAAQASTSSATPAEPKARLVIADADPIAAESLAEFLRSDGYAVTVCYTGEEAYDAVRRAAEPTDPRTRPAAYNLVIADVALPGMSGIELLEKLKESNPEVVVILLTGYGTIEAAVQAIRKGAFDYLAKPIVDSELRVTLERAVRQQVLLADNTKLRRALDERHSFANIVGSDARMAKAFEIIEAVAPTKATALITGESGTGKSMIAKAIHRHSPRREGPYVEIHCGSIPETLLESELFGHVRGAFTGATTDKPGRFLAADGGTLFIDEINSASPSMQLKLLRVLQERRFEPVGSTETVEVDVRILLATNEPLEPLVARGDFRQDLYYRINVVKIELPALRERASDIPMLVERFIDRYAQEHNKTVTGLTAEAMAALRRYDFPGNVRELENIIERAVLLSSRPSLGLEDLPNYVTGAGPVGHGGRVDASRAGLWADDAIDAPDTPWVPMPLAEALREPERRIILKALRANDWNRQATATQLDINRTTLWKKMKEYGLDQMSG
jgi:DNA-binding NtrC family response regulator